MRLKSERGIYERKVREEDVVLAIRQYLELHRMSVYRIRERIAKWGGRPSERGIPDLMGWIPSFWRTPGGDHNLGTPRAFFIEVKRPGGKRRASQEIFIDRARRDGLIACFAESIDDVRAEFSRHNIILAGS